LSLLEHFNPWVDWWHWGHGRLDVCQ
jgi:hypothetical protein